MSAGGGLLVLGYDGVLVDAGDEDVVVSWFGGRPLPGGGTLAELRAQVPAVFVERYRAVAVHARTPDQLVVAHDERAGDLDLAGAGAFAALLAGVDAEHVARFRARATAAREEIRRRDRAGWLAAHAVHAEVAALLRACPDPVVVLTAGDSASVAELLDAHRLTDQVTRIVGRCADKATAVAGLALHHGVPPAHTVFIDGSLDDVVAAGQLGIAALWARWGPHGAGQRRRSDDLGVAALDLADVGALSRPDIPLAG
jgi:FMN phosphatase YigB (HAD superfamily)